MKRINIFSIIIALFFLSFNTIILGEEDYQKKADEYFRQGKFSLAEIFYKKVIEQQPENFQANYNLGKIYFDNSDYASAIQYLKTAYDLNQDKETLLLLANANLENKNPIIAMTLYSNLIKTYPDYSDAYLNAGYIGYKYFYNKSITITNWVKFLELKPFDVQAPNIKKALEYLRDPQFVLAPPSGKTNVGANNISTASSGSPGTSSSSTSSSNAQNPIILPEIKGKDLKSDAEEKYELRKRKSITTE